MNPDTLLVAKVTEIKGTRIRAKVLQDKNEAFIFDEGNLIRNVSVGGYVKIPCGFKQVVGRIEGEVQQELRSDYEGYENHAMPAAFLDRYIDISVFGVKSGSKFERGITVLPLVSSDVYVLSAAELALISSPTMDSAASFRIGSLSGYDGISVSVPPSKLFASHIGVFGNTGSGKSNTLCRIYSDCFQKMENAGSFKLGKSYFVFIDFNGEYTAKEVLTPGKQVLKLSTRTKGGMNKIAVPRDFYFDVEIWSILTQATEKTQKPFLKSSVRLAKQIVEAKNSERYIKKVVHNLFEEYLGSENIFLDQREDLIYLFSQLFTSEEDPDEDEIRACFEHIESFNHAGASVLRRDHEFYGNTATELLENVFGPFFNLCFDYGNLTADIPTLLEFSARVLYLQRWRSGSIIREHISCWLPRLSTQLSEARKLYCLLDTEKDMFAESPVLVFSLRDVNQEQKKMVPLILAKYLYEAQKLRGREDDECSTHLIVDEAHNILSYSSQRESEGWRDYRLETFEEIVKEGRKFGMYLTVSSQRPSDISTTIISQLHNYFIHRLVNDEDLMAISKAVAFIDSATSSMIPVLPQGCCVASGTAIPYPTQVQVEQLPEEMRPRSADRDLASAWAFNLF